MKQVSRFESRLLQILQFFLRRVPLDQVRPLLAGSQPMPSCLSRDCIALVQDYLAKGCTLLLAQTGGWRRERFQRGDSVREGRLWQRTAPTALGLSFSRHTLRFLMWITANHPQKEDTEWMVPATERTPADELLFYFAFAALRDTEFAPSLQKRAGFVDNPLCRLAFPGNFSLGHTGDELDFHPWTEGLRACLLEALQPELTALWMVGERQQAAITDWTTLRERSRSKAYVLEAFVRAVEAAGRLDLARFLLQTASRLLTADAVAAQWVPVTAGAGMSWAERLETYRAALALVRSVEQFYSWERRARSVGFLDEEYAASQLFKNEWERWGGANLVAHARRIMHELDPMCLASEGQS